MEGCDESGVGEGGEGKSRGEIGGEAGEVTGVVANEPTTDGLGERYRKFSGWRMAATFPDQIHQPPAIPPLFQLPSPIH